MTPHCGICKHFHRFKDDIISNKGRCIIDGKETINVSESDGRLCYSFKENYEVVHAMKKMREKIEKSFKDIF
jgi:hypothetical protein